MMRVLSLLGLSILFNASAATYYVDFAGGSDANSGTKISPWKRHPFMAGWIGSYSHSAGDTFIFKGGVTWTSSWPFKISVGGSSNSTRDIYTTDPTWYNGGSFTKPIFDANSGFWAGGVGGSIVWINTSNVTFDNIDTRNLLCIYQNDDGKFNIVVYGTALNNITISNCSVHDWFITDFGGQVLTASFSPNVQWDANGVGGIGFIPPYGDNCRVSSCILHQAGIVQKSGCALRKVSNVDNTEIYSTPNAYLGAGTIHDCHFHDLPAPTDPVSHGNAIETFDPSVIYNNRLHDFDGHIAPMLLGPDGSGNYGIDLVYNNLMYRTGSQPPLRLDTSGAHPSLCGLRAYNNTIDVGGAGTPISASFRSASYTYQLLDCRNNHLITTGTPVGFNSQANGWGNVSTVITQNNLTVSPADAASAGYTSSSDYAPSSLISPTVGIGQNLSSYYTIDINGVTRTVPWDVGIHQWTNLINSPGVIVLSTNVTSNAENLNTTITLKRTTGSTGLVGISYTTANGSALDGVNYNSTAGSLSWPDGNNADQTITLTNINTSMIGNKSYSFSISTPTGGATLGSPNVETITLTGVGVPSTNLLAGLSWEAEAGTLQPPFVSNTVAGVTYISQPIQTLNTGQGIASYTFTNVAGNFTVQANAQTPSDAANSVYLDFNNYILTDPTPIWDMPVSGTNWTNATACWRGTGTFDAPQIVPKVWTLSAGTNTLYVLGREANTLINTITVSQLVTNSIVNIVSLSSVNGWFKSGSVVPITVTTDGPATVTGTPQLTLNNTSVINFGSGSGTTNLVFNYTVIPGHDTNVLDIASTNALALNGGTIKDAGGTDINLTLPVPGQPGSLSYASPIGIDTISPTLILGTPSITNVTSSADVVQIPLTYSDLNLFSVSPNIFSITVNMTGTVVIGSLTVTAGRPVSTLRLTGLVGHGTLAFNVLSGTANDLAGNLAPAAGPSNTIFIDVRSALTIHNATFYNLTIP